METSSTLPTGLLTSLFTEIEGSTRLVKALGREGCRQLFETDTRVMRSATAGNKGVEVDRHGDSSFAVFRRTGQAIVAAVETQQGRGATLARGAHVAVRMGMRTGEVAPRRGGPRRCRRP
jgi:class 3 adenylate cyclase